jgi:predicted ATPase
MTQLEDRIGQFETRLGELQTSMGNEAVWSDAEALAAVVAEQEAVSKDLAAHEQAWLDRGG